MNINSKSSTHARSFEFTRKTNPLFQDNSIFKASRIKSILHSKGSEYKKKENILKGLIKNREQVKAKREAESRLKSLINENLKEYSAWQVNLNRSAEMIQKHVRGFLARKKIKVLIENHRKKHAQACVNNMHQFIYTMWIDPKYFLIPVQIIESHYRRYKNRKRILSIIDLYIKYCYDKKAERFRVFEYIALLSAKFKLWKVKEPVIIRRRLETIRNNLKMLQIKYYWTRNKLTPIKIIAKARKFKKILNSKKKPERTYSLNASNFPSPYIWRYSMVSLPIVYNENILLGSGNSKRNSKIVTRRGRNTTIGRRNVTCKTSNGMNLPVIKPNSSLGRTRARSPGMGNSLSATNQNLALQNYPKIEVIAYHSPMAESLGYKGFNFKVWRPIFRQTSTKGSVTPTLPKSSFLKSSHLKPGLILSTKKQV